MEGRKGGSHDGGGKVGLRIRRPDEGRDKEERKG